MPNVASNPFMLNAVSCVVAPNKHASLLFAKTSLENKIKKFYWINPFVAKLGGTSSDIFFSDCFKMAHTKMYFFLLKK
jgi:hypothetical protein